jgi:hypothetical protein
VRPTERACRPRVFAWRSSESAQTVFTFDCDVGRFSPNEVSRGNIVGRGTSTKVEASAGLSALIDWIVKGPSVKASRQWTRTSAKSIKGTFNVHEENKGACGPRGLPRFDVGVRNCLNDNTIVPKNGSTAGLRFEARRPRERLLPTEQITFFKVTQVRASGDHDVKITYTIKINAPAKKNKKSRLEVIYLKM